MNKIIAAACLILAGCSVISLSSPVNNPKTGEMIPCHVTYISFLKSHDEISGGACGGTAGASGSKVELEALGSFMGSSLAAYQKAQSIP